MSKFSGRQYKGAMRDYRRMKRTEAEERQRNYEREVAEWEMYGLADAETVP